MGKANTAKKTGKKKTPTKMRKHTKNMQNNIAHQITKKMRKNVGGAHKVVAYTRTSSKTNMGGDNQGRATPEQHFFRRVHFAVVEYERDCLVERLRSGLQAAAANRGGVAAQGRKSIIDKIKPTQQQREPLKKLIARREGGDFGYRPLAQKMSAVLGLKTNMSMETCRWVCASLQ